MEFLNGLKNSAGTVSWESLPRSREAGHSTSCFESGTLRPALKADLFGKMPRLLACGSAARVLQCTEGDYSHSPTHPSRRDFKREFLSAGSSAHAAARGSMVNVKSLYRQTGQMFYRPWRRRVIFCVLCSVFQGWFPPSSFLSVVTFSLAETFNLQSSIYIANIGLEDCQTTATKN